MATRLINADALTALKTLSSHSVDCVITSPPYWSLRNYKIEGEQLGQEENFSDYINNLCDIFDEVKRVLSSTGVCFVNIGDTYFNAQLSNRNFIAEGDDKVRGGGVFKLKRSGGIAKSLCQIPNRFAIEMCERGWILRNEIIWHKPNARPDPTKDRFGTDYEKVFMFVKDQNYKFNVQRELVHKNGQPVEGGGLRQKRSVWSISTARVKGHFAVFPKELVEILIKAGSNAEDTVLDPFVGTGTTMVVAQNLGRASIGIEISKEYCELVKERVRNEGHG